MFAIGARGRWACCHRSARCTLGPKKGIYINVVLSNVKRSISGSYHAIKQAKYARRYLAEAAYRFNRRFRLADFVPRLLRAMILLRPLRRVGSASGDEFS
jgi:hypothetical protein